MPNIQANAQTEADFDHCCDCSFSCCFPTRHPKHDASCKQRSEKHHKRHSDEKRQETEKKTNDAFIDLFKPENQIRQSKL